MGGRSARFFQSIYIRMEQTAKPAVAGGGSNTTPISYESVDKKLHTLRLIKAKESVRVAVRRFAEAAEEAVSHNGIRFSDVKWIIPHQANSRILQQVAKRLDVPL